MIRNQSTGYGAEVWSLDIQSEKESMVVAGPLEQCKSYMMMLLRMNTPEVHYFIMTGTNRIIWDSDTSDWITLLTPTEPQ